VAVDIEPALVDGNVGAGTPEARPKKSRPREIVVVRLDDDLRPAGGGDEITDILPA
jgi:hypothetical protein